MNKFRYFLIILSLLASCNAWCQVVKEENPVPKEVVIKMETIRAKYLKESKTEIAKYGAPTDRTYNYLDYSSQVCAGYKFANSDAFKKRYYRGKYHETESVIGWLQALSKMIDGQGFERMVNANGTGLYFIRQMNKAIDSFKQADSENEFTEVR
jgi:hypothetical protein